MKHIKSKPIIVLLGLLILIIFCLTGYGQDTGNKKKAKEVFEKVLKSENRAAFGYIAAEVDLKNMLKRFNIQKIAPRRGLIIELRSLENEC